MPVTRTGSPDTAPATVKSARHTTVTATATTTKYGCEFGGNRGSGGMD